MDQHFADRRPDRQRTGQAGTLDAEQGDQAVEAMNLSAVQLEIGLDLAGPMQLGPDSGIVRRQGAVRQRRPEAADVVKETLRKRRFKEPSRQTLSVGRVRFESACMLGRMRYNAQPNLRRQLSLMHVGSLMWRFLQ